MKTIQFYLNYVVILFITVISIISCSKEPEKNILSTNEMPKEEAYAEFSKILSKAVFNEIELRRFLKAEALKQYDKDYDVFCPWTLEKAVDGRTFREILKKYDDHNNLTSIFYSLPKLTILVPDWSWVNNECFNVNTWDTEKDEVSVGYQSNKYKCYTYFNGIVNDTLELGTFTNMPLLILKENERMIKKPETKGNKGMFDFISEEFDNSINVRGFGFGGTYGFPYDFPKEKPNNYMDDNSLPTKVLNAYDITESQDKYPQRDYIYYSIKSKNDTGRLDINYREVIHKIKFTNLGEWALNTSNGPLSDFKFNDYWLSGNYNLYKEETLKTMSWAEGNIELVFYIYNGERVTRLARSLTLNDAFDVVHIYNVRKYNWIGALQTSHYYIDEKCVQPKWVEVDWGLFIWDLSKLTREYKIEVYELDGGKDETKTVTEEFSYSGNIKVDQSIGVTPNKVVNIKVGSEAGGAISKKENKTYSYTYKYNDNLLGETYVDYRDNIILSKGNGKSKMHIYNCGDVDLMIIPMYN